MYVHYFYDIICLHFCRSRHRGSINDLYYVCSLFCMLIPGLVLWPFPYFPTAKSPMTFKLNRCFISPDDITKA